MDVERSLDDRARSAVRPSHAVIQAAGAVLAVGALLSWFLPATPGYEAATAGISVLGLAATSLVMVLHRNNSHPHELPVWRWLTVMAGVVTLVAGARFATMVVAPETFAAARHYVDAVAQLAACGAAYQALIWWDRGATRIFNPGDWLNGVSATLAASAVANLATHAAPSLFGEQSSLAVEASLVQIAAATVLVGTIPSVASLGGLARDRRFWVASAGIALTVCAPAAAGFTSSSSAGFGHVAELGVPLVAWAQLRPAGRTAPPRRSTTQATTVGALVVLFAAVLVLVVVTQVGPEQRGVTVGLALGAIAGVSVRMTHIIRDLALLAETRQEALTDELTGVANRRALMKRLADVDASTGALLLLDINSFKEVNDRLGHAAGDELLRVLSTRVLSVLDLDALLARLGGDEFAVLLAGPRHPDRLEMAHRIVAAAARAVVIDGHRVQVGVSVGMAVVDGAAFGEAVIDGVELLRRADAAMYVAKSARIPLAVYDPQLDADHASRMRLLEQLRALSREVAEPGDGDAGQLLTYYQPQVDTRTGFVHGAEALVRWDHPELGVLAPAAFLPLAEEHGLMEVVTTSVVRRAVRDAAQWHRLGHALRVSVNVSTSCLTAAGLVPMITQQLAETGLPPDLLVIEVTETVAIADAVGAAAVLNALVAAGVWVSIDDYGTGHSSLAYLKDLPVSELKLDRSFTVDLLRDARTAAIVAATIELAHRLDIAVVGEGVEDYDTVQALQALGCERTQGYYHGVPMSDDDFTRWLTRHVPQPQAIRPVA